MKGQLYVFSESQPCTWIVPALLSLLETYHSVDKRNQACKTLDMRSQYQILALILCVP